MKHDRHAQCAGRQQYGQTQRTTPHIVFSGGGTGGHLFPGLAVAEKIVEYAPFARITFAGGGKPLEYRHVANAGYDYWALASHPMPRRFGELVPFLIENAAGRAQARRFMSRDRVDAVVGLGGYASVPIAQAAVRHRSPLVLMEQNAVAGRATKWLARHATLICVAMPQTRKSLKPKATVQVTGTPIRSAHLETSVCECRSFPPRRSPRRLLILGGSCGARFLNQNIPRALYQIHDRLADWQIFHQSGDAELAATQALYDKLGLRAEVRAFFEHVPQLMAEADLAVCRAGGSTLAELAVAGLPAVLVPYPEAVADHQRRNADAYAHAGAASVFDQRDIAGRFDHALAETLLPFIEDSSHRDRMALAMRRLARPRAAADVALHVLRAVGIQPPELRAVGEKAERSINESAIRFVG